MKIIMIEATAEEISANRRVGDAVCDAVMRMADSISRIPWYISDDDDDDEEEEEVKDDAE